MSTATITKKEYTHLLKRQEKIEEELDVVKKILRAEAEEVHIKPTVLKRWERISRDLDRGKGRSFSSLKEMRGWLKSL